MSRITMQQVQAPDFKNAFDMFSTAYKNMSDGISGLASSIKGIVNDANAARYNEALKQILTSDDPVQTSKDLINNERYGGVLPENYISSLANNANVQNTRNYDYLTKDSNKALAAYDARIRAAENNGDVELSKKLNQEKADFIAANKYLDNNIYADVNNIRQEQANIANTNLRNAKTGLDLKKEQDIENYLNSVIDYINTRSTALDIKDPAALLFDIRANDALSPEDKNRLQTAVYMISQEPRFNSIFNNPVNTYTMGTRALEKNKDNLLSLYDSTSQIKNNPNVQAWNNNVTASEQIHSVADMTRALEQNIIATDSVIANVPRDEISAVKNIKTLNIDSNNLQKLSAYEEAFTKAFGSPEEGKRFANFLLVNANELSKDITDKTGIPVSDPSLLYHVIASTLISDPELIENNELLPKNSKEYEYALNLGQRVVEGAKNGSAFDTYYRIKKLLDYRDKANEVMQGLKDTESAMVASGDIIRNAQDYNDSSALTYSAATAEQITKTLNGLMDSGIILIGRNQDEIKKLVSTNENLDQNSGNKELQKKAIKDQNNRAIREAYIKDMQENTLPANADPLLFYTNTQDNMVFPNFNQEVNKQQAQKNAQEVVDNYKNLYPELYKELVTSDNNFTNNALEVYNNAQKMFNSLNEQIKGLSFAELNKGNNVVIMRQLRDLYSFMQALNSGYDIVL